MSAILDMILKNNFELAYQHFYPTTEHSMRKPTLSMNGSHNALCIKQNQGQTEMIFARKSEKTETNELLLNLICHCFVTWCLTLIGSCGSSCCNILHCLNIGHQILLVPEMQCCQYDAVRTAVFQISGIQNDT